MNGFQIALGAGVAIILVIVVIAMRNAGRGRAAATRSSGEPGDTTASVDSSGSDCGSSDGGGGCD